jgi:hypothetical protein
MIKKFTIVAAVLSLAGCAHVRREDLDAWVGQPGIMAQTPQAF